MNPTDFQHAYVFVNGEADAETLARVGPHPDSLIVAVDGGLRHCLACGLTPHWLVGDLDSIPETSLPESTVIERFPVEKDQTDLELALLKLEQHAIPSITLVGIDGGRIDHALTNMLLVGHRDWPFAIHIVVKGGNGAVVTAQHPYPGGFRQSGIPPIDTTLSLISLSPTVHGVTAEGVHYPLDDAQLTMGGTLGMSNVVTSEHCTVRVRSGRLLVLNNFS